MGNRTKKLQPKLWHRAMKKQPSWNNVKDVKSEEAMERLNESGELKELLTNINSSPDGIIRILRR